MKTLIENAIVLTMDDEMRVFDRGYVLTDGANIAEVGAGRFAGDADERIDARGDAGRRASSARRDRTGAAPSRPAGGYGAGQRGCAAHVPGL